MTRVVDRAMNQPWTRSTRNRGRPEFGFGLDTFGHDPRPEHMGDIDDVLQEMALAGIGVDIGNEMAVDLQIVDRVVAKRFISYGRRRSHRPQTREPDLHLATRAANSGTLLLSSARTARSRWTMAQYRHFQMLQQAIQELFALDNQPDVEIEEKRGGRPIGGVRVPSACSRSSARAAKLAMRSASSRISMGLSSRSAPVAHQGSQPKIAPVRPRRRLALGNDLHKVTSWSLA